MFEHVKTAYKTQSTATVAIEGLSNMRPILTAKPATEANEAYWNALLQRNRRNSARRRPKMTAAMLKRFRNDERELMARHCVTGWESGSVVDAKGKPVPFSFEACHALFKALPNDIFDEFRDEITDPAVFWDHDDPDDLEEQAGN